jgi:hypothetical protein
MFGAHRGACSTSAQWRTSVVEPEWTFSIDISPYRDKKNADLQAHCTQYLGLKKLFGDDTTTALEAFRLAWRARLRDAKHDSRNRSLKRASNQAAGNLCRFP